MREAEAEFRLVRRFFLSVSDQFSANADIFGFVFSDQDDDVLLVHAVNFCSSLSQPPCQFPFFVNADFRTVNPDHGHLPFTPAIKTKCGGGGI